jgi:hypothetical protein
MEPNFTPLPPALAPEIVPPNHTKVAVIILGALGTVTVVILSVLFFIYGRGTGVANTSTADITPTTIIVVTPTEEITATPKKKMTVTPTKVPTSTLTPSPSTAPTATVIRQR